MTKQTTSKTTPDTAQNDVNYLMSEVVYRTLAV